MRKRKRGYGSYLDEETGEVTTVQTTKQAKRAHQKTGKWYKEPTAKELRIWEREAKQKEAAEKALKREENKRKNAAKRAEKEAKELEVKQQQFLAGKITFTQTLAKKDEDQLNLHSWFGGKPQKQKPAEWLSHAAKEIDENKENHIQGHSELHGDSHVAHRSHNPNLTLNLSQLSGKNGQTDSKPFHLQIPSPSPCNSEENMAESTKSKNQCLMDLDQDQDISYPESFEDFDIAEDLDAEPESSDCDELQQRSAPTDDVAYEFRVPALPTQHKRLPLSPMSKSDVNIRNSQTQNVGVFTKRLELSSLPSLSTTKAANLPSTQAVKELLSGFCTQDFNDDDIDEEYYDKENRQPETTTDGEESPSKPTNWSHLEPEVSLSKGLVKERYEARSFPPLSDSFDGHDYDNIFAELEDTIDNVCADNDDSDDFFDGGLDDDTLLSLPATQILRSAAEPGHFLKKTSSDPIMNSFDASRESKQMHTKALETVRNCDSFAIDGLSDDDLLQGLKEYEQSQKASNSDPAILKKRRAYPWDKPGWIAETSGGHSQATTADSLECSQKTELLPSQTY